MSLIPRFASKQVQRLLRLRGFEIRPLPKSDIDNFPDFDRGFCDIVRSKPRVTAGIDINEYTTYKTVEYIVSRGIPDDIVECGVYRGRQILMMAHTLMALGVTDRDIYLYDTFAGMTKPTELDYTSNPRGAADNLARWEANRQPDGSNRYKFAGIDEVRRTVFATGYPPERFKFVPGDVEETLETARHQHIAFLRLDTDWHDSTKVELEKLYEHLVVGGVLVLDDYGRWKGQRKAVDDFLAMVGPRAPMLIRTSPTERLCIKVRS
jgi:O-methyltransferase